MEFYEKANEVVDYFTLPNAAYVFLAYLTINFIWQIVHYRFLHPLRDFPGPFEIAFEEELVRKYGNIFRISPTMLFVSTASSLPSIYYRTARKTPHYTLFSFGKEPSIFQMHEHGDYVNRAKTITGIYSTRAHMQSTEETINRHSVACANSLRRRFLSKNLAFDLSKWVAYLTMDIAIEISFGPENSLEYVKSGKDVHGIQKGTKDSLPLFGVMCRMHPFVSWLNTTWFGVFFDWFMVHLDPQMGRPIRFTDLILKRRLGDADAKEKNDILQAFINARTPQGEQLSRTTLRGELLITILAGTESTTAGICTTIFHLIQNPKSLQRVLAERNSAISSGHISDAPQHAEILKHCPFYVACVKESLRFNPSLSSIIPRHSTSDEANPLVLHGRNIPPKTEVSCHPYIIHRDITMFGKDPAEWKPERWLDSEKAKVLERYNFTFGYGSRHCLGRQLGMMSVLKIVLLFLKSFHIELALNTTKPRLIGRVDFGFWEDLVVNIKN